MTTIEREKRLLNGARIWRINRLKYPGWIIAPKLVRKRIWRATENWINPLSSLSSDYSPYEKLFMFRELNWRLELTLMPLLSNFAASVKELLEGLNVDDLSGQTLSFPAVAPQSSSSLPEERLLYASDFEFSEEEVKRSWIKLNLAFLRYLREERQQIEFSHLTDSILNTPSLQPDDIACVRYEQSLFGLSNFEPEKAREALTAWPETSSLVWQSRKASIHLRLGQIETGYSIAQDCYQRIQTTQRNHLTNLRMLSCESWLLMMLQSTQDHFEFRNPGLFDRVSRNNFERRIDQLERMKYDPWKFLGEFRSVVDQSPPTYQTESRSAGFQPNQVSTTHHFGANFLGKEMPAYEVMRFSEVAPMPHGFGGVNLCRDSLRKAGEWMIPRDSIRTDSILLLLKDMKLVDSYLSRHRVAAMDKERVESLYRVVKNGVATAISPSEANDPTSNSPEAVNVQLQVSTGIEIMARLCVRLSVSEQTDLLDYAFTLFRSEAVARNRHSAKPMRSLFRSLLLSIPLQSLKSKFRDFVSLPIPNTDTYSVQDSYSWPYPVYLFAESVSGIGKVKTKEWNGHADRLLDLAINGNAVARKRAVVQLNTLCYFGCLGKKRTARLADVYWREPFSDGLPKSDIFNRADCLSLPSPKDVDVEKRFKTYALATGKDSSEGDINDLVKSWLAAERTTGNESNLNTTVIEWSKTDLKRIIELANQQWEKLKQDLAMQNSQANHFATAMGGESFDGKIQNLLSALRDVVFPRVGSRKALRRKLKTLIEDIADSGSSIQMLLPIMPLLDSSLDIEAEMRLGLASHDRHVYVTTLQGLLFWAKSVSRQDESSNDTSLSELPIDLMRELGVTLANRRQPHLDQAMAAVKVYLRSSNKPLDQQFLDSLNHGLHYLQAELEYRFWDDGNSQFEYDEIPNLRFKTVQIAVCMKRDRGVASNAVGNWIESAKSDSLPEIRRLVEEVPM